MSKLLFFVLLPLFLAKTEPRLRFTYEEKPQLSWKDFKGIPQYNTPYQASTNCGIGYDVEKKVVHGKVTVQTTVHSYFYPELSWKRDINENDPSLLAHEQLHWDITELHAIILRKRLAAYIPTANYKKEIHAIFENVEAQRKKMQLLYDKETVHGRDKIAQSNWQVRVNEFRFRL